MEVASRVKPLPEILALTKEAWDAVDTKVFQSAWIICGYVSSNHFDSVATDVVQTVDAAKAILDPCGVLSGTSLEATPQFCQVYDWQIEDPETFCTFF